KLNEIPNQTLAGGQAQQRLEAFQRDYDSVAGTTANVQQSNNLIVVAKNYGIQAAEASQGAPHPVSTWARAERLWQEAITVLDKVPEEGPGYVEAQALRADYISNKDQIKAQKEREQKAVDRFALAEAEIVQLVDQFDRGEIRGLQAQFQKIIQQLEKIPANTTVSTEAQQLRQQAQAKLNELRQVLD
ncbi:MAG: hypothetical protein AAGF93_10860, partial [Cyanobacteria bacterium P01_H01_bin.105]